MAVLLTTQPDNQWPSDVIARMVSTAVENGCNEMGLDLNQDGVRERATQIAREQVIKMMIDGWPAGNC